jgi:hypothetical protein
MEFVFFKQTPTDVAVQAEREVIINYLNPFIDVFCNQEKMSCCYFALIKTVALSEERVNKGYS